MLEDAVALFPIARVSNARRRTIASRLYYTAYHAALAYARGRSYVDASHKGSVHANLRRFLASTGNAEMAEIADYLSILFSRRLTADYELREGMRYPDLEDSRNLVVEILKITQTKSA